MRTAFIKTVVDLAATHENLWVINGDLGFSVLEPFRDKFPARYLNAGVAEQNMTGIACGLALAGKTVFTYSIANFPIFRCLEQIRNDICYHDLDVKIAAVGGGLAYGAAGYSHHAVEDLAVMRALPNMVVLAPADPIETELAVRAAVAYKGPCYIRLGKAGEPVVHKTRPEFAIGKGIFVRRGQPDAPAIISTGGMLGTTIAAADVLQLRGIKPSVVSMPTVKPLDREMIDELAATCRAIITVEEHGVGGLGSAVAEMIIECARRPRFHAVRLEGLPPNYVGTQEVLRSQRGLSADAIVGVVERLCAQDSARAAAT